MRRLALILAIFAAGPSLGQVTLSNFSINNLEVLRLNRSSCEEDFELRLSINNVSGGPYQLRFMEIDRAFQCPENLVDLQNGPFVFGDGNDDANGKQITPLGGEQPIETVKGADLLRDVSCSDAGRRVEIYLCAQLFALPGATEADAVAQISLDIDTTVPPVPEVKRIVGGNGKVTVTFEDIASDDGDEFRFRVESRLCPLASDEITDADDDSTCGASASADVEEVIDGNDIDVDADNGRVIEFRAFALDDFDNESEPSDWQQAESSPDLSPLDLYDGAENGLSCDTSSCDDTSSASLFGALALLRLRRRRRSASAVTKKATTSAAALLLLATLASTTASAQSGQDDPERKRLWKGLGRGTVSMSVGSYKPNLDADSSFPVYACFFDDATLAQLSGGGDLHLWDGFGSLQLSVSVDIMQANGFAQPIAAGTSGSCEKPTTTAVQLTMASVRPGLTYRFDPFLDWFGIPLVPYGRVGLVGTGYLFSEDGEVAAGSHNPIGARYGAEGALGLMLALDFLDPIDPFTPEATRRARANGVFDHTFVFIEGAVMDVTSFGEPGFDLSPKDDFVGSGLPATFRVGVAVELL